jgi:hypothetical protein
MATTAGCVSDQELLRAPRDGQKYEVLSPNDRWSDGFAKVSEYLDVGTRLVWVIDPERRTAAVYRSATDVRTLGETDVLDR